mmetsp:Transcript_22206/g.46209  ORF Transcript_22206/g.46209 Transcript_22206/m.46209 type:complete len:258 (-) Transcript_22206:730-1503(-)
MYSVDDLLQKIQLIIVQSLPLLILQQTLVLAPSEFPSQLRQSIICYLQILLVYQRLTSILGNPSRRRGQVLAQQEPLNPSILSFTLLCFGQILESVTKLLQSPTLRNTLPKSIFLCPKRIGNVPIIVPLYDIILLLFISLSQLLLHILIRQSLIIRHSPDLPPLPKLGLCGLLPAPLWSRLLDRIDRKQTSQKRRHLPLRQPRRDECIQHLLIGAFPRKQIQRGHRPRHGILGIVIHPSQLSRKNRPSKGIDRLRPR